MIWEYYAKHESHPDGYWKGDGVSYSPNETAPLGSTYGVWSSDGNLVFTELKNGDRLRRIGGRDKSFEREEKETAIDGNYISVNSLPKVQILFQLRGKQLGMSLAVDRDDAALANLAQRTGSAKIQMNLNGLSVPFKTDPQQRWAATIDWKAGQALPAKAALASVEGKFEVQVSWKWKARSTRLVDQDGNTLYKSQMSQTPDNVVRIVFDQPIPPGLMFAQRWSILPYAAENSGEYTAAIEGDGRQITCREFLGGLTGSNFLLTASGFEPEVDASAWNRQEKRNFAILNQQGSVEPRQKTTQGSHSYGPPHPFVIGSGKPSTGMYLLDGTRFREFNNPAFKVGSLPGPPLQVSDFLELVLFTSEEMSEKEVAGIFKLAVNVPSGRWGCKRYLSVRKHFVSWNGLVDEVEISRVQWNGTTRALARFTNGFDLDPNLWFCAPFLGVATNRESKWWGNANDPNAARLARRGSRFAQIKLQEQWGVEGGRWVEITSDEAIDHYAEFITKSPANLMLFSGEDSAGCSGPVLEVKEDRQWPRVVGWLASTSDEVELSLGRVTLGSDGEDRVELMPGEDPDAKTTSVRLRNALKKALQSPNELEGQVDGVYWRREDGIITAREVEFMGTGIYVLSNMH